MRVSEFITPSLLKELHPEDLAAILAPLKGALKKRGILADDSGKYPTQELLDFLRNTALPAEIEDAFFVIPSLVKCGRSEAVLIELMNMGADLFCDEYKQAASLWFAMPARCKEILARGEALRSRKYNYYRPMFPLSHVVFALDSETLQHVKRRLSKWFDKQGKSDYIMLLQDEDENNVFVGILHGSNRQRQTTVDSDGSRVISYRAEISDVVRVNKKTGSIGICLRYRNPLNEKHLLKTFGALFAPDSEYEPENKYTLAPLYDLDRALARGAYVDTIINIRIKSVVAQVNGQRMVLSGRNLYSLWRDLPMDKVRFKSAKFGVIFAGDSTERALSIVPPFSIEYPERSGRDDDLDGLLEANGFVVKFRNEKPPDNAQRTLPF